MLLYLLNHGYQVVFKLRWKVGIRSQRYQEIRKKLECKFKEKKALFAFKE